MFAFHFLLVSRLEKNGATTPGTQRWYQPPQPSTCHPPGLHTVRKGLTCRAGSFGKWLYPPSHMGKLRQGSHERCIELRGKSQKRAGGPRCPRGLSPPQPPQKQPWQKPRPEERTWARSGRRREGSRKRGSVTVLGAAGNNKGCQAAPSGVSHPMGSTAAPAVPMAGWAAWCWGSCRCFSKSSIPCGTGRNDNAHFRMASFQPAAEWGSLGTDKGFRVRRGREGGTGVGEQTGDRNPAEGTARCWGRTR